MAIYYTPLKKMGANLTLRTRGMIDITEWHPWFAWYPVKPFFICGHGRQGMKMTESRPIWLRRCWRRRVITMYEHYEYRRWKRGRIT